MRDRRWTLVAVCTTTFMLLLDITVVNVALPNIQHDLDASLTGLQWVVDAYALTLAALILTAGALADRYGRRLLFIVGVIVFTLSSLLCGLAWNIAVLDVARAVQGVGGAALFATALALIGAEYGGPDIGGAIAVWGATIGVAVASGPLVGGILTDALGWRWVFFVNVPVGVFALFVALTRMRESRDPQATTHRRLGAADVLGVPVPDRLRRAARQRRGLEQRPDPRLADRRRRAARRLRASSSTGRRGRCSTWTSSARPAFVGVSVATFCIGAGMFALFPYLSIYLQDILGYSPLGAGLRFLPLTVFVFVVPLVMRKLAPGASLRWLLTGRPRARRGRAAADARADAELALDRAAAGPDRRRARHRPRQPDDRRGRAARRRPLAHGHGLGDQQRLPPDRRRRRRRGARRGARGPHLDLARLVARPARREPRLGSRGHRAPESPRASPALAHPATVAYVSGLNTTLLVSCAIVAVGALAAGL